MAGGTAGVVATATAGGAVDGTAGAATGAIDAESAGKLSLFDGERRCAMWEQHVESDVGRAGCCGG